jgi:hypothetical protein
VWKPVILSSVQSAKDLSIQGVHLMSQFSSTNTNPCHPNNQAHCTTRPRHRPRVLVLPQPAFKCWSLCSFFGTMLRPIPPPKPR